MHRKRKSSDTVQPVPNIMSRHLFSMSRPQSNGAEPKAFCQSTRTHLPHSFPIHLASFPICSDSYV